MKVWMNGNLVEEQRVGISILDTGLLYGNGLFETLRVHGGAVVQAGPHISRLERSAKDLGITTPIESSDLAAASQAVADANSIREGALRWTVTGGPGEQNRSPWWTSGGFIFIAPRYWEAPPTEWRAITTPSPFRLGAELPRHKTLNYLPNLLARRAALAADADEALLVCDGRVLEGAMSNFFAVVDGILRTAPVADGVLPGIVRASVLDLAKQSGVKIEERAVLEDDLAHATECFCTNSLIGVQPVTKIGSGKVGSGEAGELTRTLHDGYERLIQSG